MLNLGFTELLVILVLAIVVVGPDRLPEMVRFLGRQYGKLMRTSDELRRAFVLEADRADAEKRAEALRQRREEARKRAEEARKRRQLEGLPAEDGDAPLARPNDDVGGPGEAALADAPVAPPRPAQRVASDEAFPRLDDPPPRGEP